MEDMIVTDTVTYCVCVLRILLPDKERSAELYVQILGFESSLRHIQLRVRV